MISYDPLWRVRRLGTVTDGDSRQAAFGAGGQIDAYRIRAGIEAWIDSRWADIDIVAALSSDTEWSTGEVPACRSCGDATAFSTSTACASTRPTRRCGFTRPSQKRRRNGRRGRELHAKGGLYACAGGGSFPFGARAGPCQGSMRPAMCVQGGPVRERLEARFLPRTDCTAAIAPSTCNGRVRTPAAGAPDGMAGGAHAAIGGGGQRQSGRHRRSPRAHA